MYYFLKLNLLPKYMTESRGKITVFFCLFIIIKNCTFWEINKTNVRSEMQLQKVSIKVENSLILAWSSTLWHSFLLLHLVNFLLKYSYWKDTSTAKLKAWHGVKIWIQIVSPLTFEFSKSFLDRLQGGHSKCMHIQGMKYGNPQKCDSVAVNNDHPYIIHSNY